MDKNNKKLNFFNKFVVKSCWVIAFSLLCAILYEKALSDRNQDFQALKEQMKHLQKEKRTALKRQEDLQLQINSQSDPAWIELTLMKGLGLVPEGEQKVYFQKRGE
jgi:hypothetical protein